MMKKSVPSEIYLDREFSGLTRFYGIYKHPAMWTVPVNI